MLQEPDKQAGSLSDLPAIPNAVRKDGEELVLTGISDNGKKLANLRFADNTPAISVSSCLASR